MTRHHRKTHNAPVESSSDGDKSYTSSNYNTGSDDDVYSEASYSEELSSSDLDFDPKELKAFLKSLKRKFDHPATSKRRAKKARHEREKNAFTCFSAGMFADVISRLSTQQRAVIEKYGFGSLLHFKNCYVPRDFVQWIARHVHVSSSDIVVGRKIIPLSSESVSKVLGLPVGGKVVESEPESGKNFILRQFGESTLPSIKYFVEKLSDINADKLSEDMTVKCFMIVAISSFLCPNSCAYPSPKFLSPLQDVETTKDWDWSRCVLDFLLYHINKFVHSTKKNGELPKTLGGCIYFLAVYYLDFLDYGAKNIDNSIPRTKVWRDQMVKDFSARDRYHKHKYGKRPVKDFSATCYAQLATVQPTPAVVFANTSGPTTSKSSCGITKKSLVLNLQAFRQKLDGIVGNRLPHQAKCVLLEKVAKFQEGEEDVSSDTFQEFLLGLIEDTYEFTRTIFVHNVDLVHSFSAGKCQGGDDSGSCQEGVNTYKNEFSFNICNDYTSDHAKDIDPTVSKKDEVTTETNDHMTGNKNDEDTTQKVDINLEYPAESSPPETLNTLKLTSSTDNKSRSKRKRSSCSQGFGSSPSVASRVKCSLRSCVRLSQKSPVCPDIKEVVTQAKNDDLELKNVKGPSSKVCVNELKEQGINAGGIKMQTNTEGDQATCGIEDSDGEKPDAVVCTQKHTLVSTSMQDEHYATTRASWMDKPLYTWEPMWDLLALVEQNDQPPNEDLKGHVFEGKGEEDKYNAPTSASEIPVVNLDSEEPTPLSAVGPDGNVIDLCSPPDVIILPNKTNEQECPHPFNQATELYSSRQFDPINLDNSHFDIDIKGPTGTHSYNEVIYPTPTKRTQVCLNNMNIDGGSSSGCKMLVRRQVKPSVYALPPYTSLKPKFIITDSDVSYYQASRELARSDHNSKLAVSFSGVYATYLTLGQSLKPRGWVTNFLMNVYCKMMFVENRPDKTRLHFFFSNVGGHFVKRTNIFKVDFVKQQFTKAHSVKKLHKSFMLYFPICVDKHWFLFIVDILDRKYIFLDSIYEDDNSFHQNLKYTIVSNFRVTWQEYVKETPPDFLDQFEIEFPPVPKQTTICDCGIFVMKFIELWRPRVALAAHFTQQDIPKIRIQLLNRMLRHQQNEISLDLVNSFVSKGQGKRGLFTHAMAGGNVRSEDGGKQVFKKRMFEGLCLPEQVHITVDKGLRGRTRSNFKQRKYKKLLKRGTYSKPYCIDASESSSESEDIPPSPTSGGEYEDDISSDGIE